MTCDSHGFVYNDYVLLSVLTCVNTIGDRQCGSYGLANIQRLTVYCEMYWELPCV